jgi:hypothetical protein
MRADTERTRPGATKRRAVSSKFAPPDAVWTGTLEDYVEVSRIDEATDRARKLGAAVLLAPREGPAGWRSVIATPEAGEIALWQQKGWRRWRTTHKSCSRPPATATNVHSAT